MYILYKKGICLQLYLITIYTKTGLSFQNLQNTEIRPAWPFLHLYGLKCVPSSSAPPVPEINIFPRQGEQCPVVEFSYMDYSPPKWISENLHGLIHPQGAICHLWAPLELMFDPFFPGHVAPLEPLIKCQVSSTPLCASKNVKFRPSRNLTKFDMVTRFRKTIPMVKSVLSSEI